MAGFKELFLKGGAIADLGLVGVAQGDILVAGATPFTFAKLAKGTDGQVLTAGAATLSWTAAGTGDFKADGTVAMTAPLRLKAQSGETGMGTVDGSVFYDTAEKKIKVYIS